MAEVEIGVLVALAVLEYVHFRKTQAQAFSSVSRTPRSSTLPPLEEFTLVRTRASHDPQEQSKQPKQSKPRPVRNTFPRGFSPLRRGSISGEPMSEEDLCWSAPNIPKSEEEKNLLMRILRRNVLMQHLALESLEAVVQALQKVQVPTDQVVISEGDFGDGSFIVEDGTLSCSMKKRGLVCKYGPVTGYSG